MFGGGLAIGEQVVWRAAPPERLLGSTNRIFVADNLVWVATGITIPSDVSAFFIVTYPTDGVNVQIISVDANTWRNLDAATANTLITGNEVAQIITSVRPRTRPQRFSAAGRTASDELLLSGRDADSSNSQFWLVGIDVYSGAVPSQRFHVQLALPPVATSGRVYVFTLTDSRGIRTGASAVITSRDGRTQNVAISRQGDSNTFVGFFTPRHNRWLTATAVVTYVDATSGDSHTITQPYTITL